MRQIIKNVGFKNKFLLYWESEQGEKVKGSEIKIDFNPIIQELNLINNFAICHYQARPKGLRRWGVFWDSNYFSVNQVVSKIPYTTVLLDEKAIALPPNAVIVHKHCKVVVTDGLAEILAIA